MNISSSRLYHNSTSDLLLNHPDLFFSQRYSNSSFLPHFIITNNFISTTMNQFFEQNHFQLVFFSDFPLIYSWTNGFIIQLNTLEPIRRWSNSMDDNYSVCFSHFVDFFFIAILQARLLSVSWLFYVWIIVRDKIAK